MKKKSPGKLIRKIRQEHHLSQEEVAVSLRISQSYLSKVENDQLEFKLRDWFRFCQLMEIPYEKYAEVMPRD